MDWKHFQDGTQPNSLWSWHRITRFFLVKVFRPKRRYLLMK